MFADLLIQCVESRLQAPNLREKVCNTSIEWRLDVWVEILATPPLELIPRHECDGYLAGDVRDDVPERASPFRVEVVSRGILVVALRNPEDLVWPVPFRGGIRTRSEPTWHRVSSNPPPPKKRQGVGDRVDKGDREHVTYIFATSSSFSTRALHSQYTSSIRNRKTWRKYCLGSSRRVESSLKFERGSS